MSDREKKGQNGILAIALPAVVLVLVDWAFWGLRSEQAGWGVNIDGLAMLAAFLVALAASSSGRAHAQPQPSLLDGLLERFALASFGLLAASQCAALFAYIRLSSIWVGPELYSGRMGGRAVLVALMLVVAPCFAWLFRLAALRLPHGARIALAAGAVALCGLLALRPQEPGARLEYLRAAFHTVASLPATTLEVHIEQFTVQGAGFEYLAVGNNCVVRPAELERNRRVAEQSVAIPGERTTGGFAVCPALEIFEKSGFTYGRAVTAMPGAGLTFVISGSQVSQSWANQQVPQDAQKIAAVRSIRAPLGFTTDQDAGDGLRIKRDASNLERCHIQVLDGDRLLAEGTTPFRGSGKLMSACPPVTVTRAASLGILNVDLPALDHSGGSSPETSSVSFVDGISHEKVSLARVADRVEAPKAWRMGSLAGVAGGALALLYSLVELSRLRRLRGFLAAQHQGGGKITLADGAIIDAEAARNLEVGEVFVRGALPKARLPGYRESAQERALTLDVRAPAAVHLDWDRTSGRVTFASAIAIAFPIATSALMLVAWFFGLGG